ncbi:MAG: hypothetical protein LAT82_01335 [Nanoarchaeota archaeon]|nr:hypothetical protein [Nanoarchaeota archaeon]
MIRKKNYNKLSVYLSLSNENEIILSFEEIEEIIGKKLPNSARNHHKLIWWSNDSSEKGHVQSKEGWLNVDYKVITSLLLEGKVIFKKFNLNQNKENKLLKKNDLTWNKVLIQLDRKIKVGLKLENYSNKKYGFIEEISFGKIKIRTGEGLNGVKSTNYENLKFLFDNSDLKYKDLKKKYENMFGKNSTDCRFSNSIIILKILGVSFNF